MRRKKIPVSVLSAFLAVIMLFGFMTGLAPAQVRAASSSELKGQLNDLKKEEQKLEDKMDDIQEQIDENQSEIQKIAAQKNAIDQEIAVLNDQMLNLNEQIKTYGLLIADKQEELEAAQLRLRELNEKNKERIRAMEEDGTLSYWSVLFKANSFADLLDRLNMIEEIAAADRRRLQEMSEAAQLVADAQKELENEKSALEEARTELEGKQALLQEKRAEADELLAQLNAKSEEFNAMMDEAEAEAEDLIAQIAKTEKEYNDAKRKEEEASKPKPGTNSGYGSAMPPSHVVDGITWVMPCKYTRFSSPYGWRIHPVYKTWKFHSGVDLGAPSGTPIYASRSGKVTTAKYHYSAGNYVTVNHGDGFSTSYLHMTHDIVSEGDYVQAGQIIGYVGSTGVSTGPHLHFTIYYNGETINPANYINFH